LLDDGLIDCEAVVAPLSNHFCLTAEGAGLLGVVVGVEDGVSEAADLLPLTLLAFCFFSEGCEAEADFLEAVMELFRLLTRLDSLSPLLPLVLATGCNVGAGGDEGVWGVAEGVEEPVEERSLACPLTRSSGPP
jgi:hypothetical protein